MKSSHNLFQKFIITICIEEWSGTLLVIFAEYQNASILYLFIINDLHFRRYENSRLQTA
jgi:hypothetical protein